MSYVRIWVHIVFSTKKRKPLLPADVRKKVKYRIMENCKKNNIFLQCVNGYTDHMHCVVSLGRDQTISKVVQHIKGESSRWINDKKLIEEIFNWQDDYYAVSVSQSDIQRVINYVKNQEEHHRKKTLKQELDEFAKRFGWDIQDEL